MDFAEVAISADVGIIMGSVAAIIAAVVTPMFALMNRQQKTHQEIAHSLDKLADNQLELGKKIDKNTNAVKQGAKKNIEYWKERNGKMETLIKSVADRNLESYKKLHTQDVKEQVVHHQIVEGT